MKSGGKGYNMKRRFLLSFLVIFSMLTMQASAALKPVMGSRAALHGGNTGVGVYGIMYHRLTENANELSEYCIYANDFESDIAYLKENGYVFLSPDDIRTGNFTNKNKYVIITFDDGYSSDYKYALPILEKYQVPAVFFVVAGLIGTPDYMTPEELNLLAQSPYVTVGSHTNVFHNYNPHAVKEKISSAEGRYEYVMDVKSSITKLEEITKKPVINFAYPYGMYNAHIEYELREAVPNLITYSSDQQVNMRMGAGVDMIGRYNRANKVSIATLVR